MDPNAVVGFISGPLALAAAIAVFALGPGRPMNRWLACFLLLDAATEISAAVGNLQGLPEDIYYGFNGVFLFGVSLQPLAYLLLMRPLATPLVGWLRHRAVVAGLAAATIAYAAIVLFVLSDVADPAGWDVYDLVFAVGTAVPIYGFFAAASAFRRGAPGSIQRSQARAFMLAFGLRDLLYVAFTVNSFAYQLGFSPWEYANIYGIATPFFGPLLFVPLAAYAIFTAHLFDIDVKVKLSLKRGTIGAAFIAAFFVASEAAQTYFQQTIGTVVGLAAAGLLVFALSPLQRLADKLANAAMPEVHDSPEFIAMRKLDVYKAAVESAHESGGISDKERESLIRLQAKLGIRGDDARAIESQVVA